MLKGAAESFDILSLFKALLLLDELKLNEVDTVVSDQLRTLLINAQHVHQDITQGYASLLCLALDAIAARAAAANDAVLEKQLRIMILRLSPPLLPSELNSLKEYMLAILNRLNETNFGNALPPSSHPSVRPPSASTARGMAPPVGFEVDIGSTKQNVDGLMREQLHQKNQEFSQIRSTLSRHVNEAIAQNQEFGVLLGVELDELHEAERIQDVEKRRLTLINEINKFVKKHRLLSDKFDSANKYLNLVESSNQHLSDELDRARLLSLTDELTGLSNRRAFLYRMEDEVGRVKRYGIPVSMAIIDLDGFKAINDLWGHGGGDVVLRNYAEQIMSVFRHHDMVARYGGEEFAVILPNTGCEGAYRALQKVQSRVSEVICTHNGQRFPMPTFSAGVAEYRHGEILSDFVERADMALYRAKHLGRNRIEIAEELNDEIVNKPADDLDAARHA